MLLKDKIAIVTGGSSGNGRAICSRFVEQGARVIVADLTETPREGGPATADMINAETPDSAVFQKCDVTKLDDLESCVALAESMGGLDILVNNAGILKKQPLLEADEAMFQQMIDVNVKSVLFASQAAAKVMIPRGSGVIINLCSIAGMRGTGGFCHYNLTKGAVRLLTYSMADELGPHGIRVNNIAPGIMHTQMNIDDDPVIGTPTGEGYLDMIPARRWGTTNEVADGCVYLACDMAKYVMGTTLTIDEGYLRV